MGAFTALPALVERAGGDFALVCSSAELDPTVLDRATNFIRYEDLAHVLGEAARQTKCPHFGLMSGGLWHVSDFGLIGEFMRNSPSVAAALRGLELYQHLNSQGAVVYLLERDDSVDLGFGFYKPFEHHMSFVQDAAMAAGLNILIELTGSSTPVSGVRFSHSRPSDIEPYRKLFRANLHFNSRLSALRIPNKMLEKPIEGAQVERLEFCRNQLMESGKANLVELVFRSLRALLLTGKASGDEVARTLAMHRRTLNRRLANEGVSFHEILDKVRFAVATELLRESDAKIPKIAQSTAYSDPASFIRAFKRWTGMTPGQWRQRCEDGSVGQSD